MLEPKRSKIFRKDRGEYMIGYLKDLFIVALIWTIINVGLVCILEVLCH